MTYIIIGIGIIFIILYQIGKSQQKNNSEHGITFNVKTETLTKKDKHDSKWEIVYRETERWKELGFENEEAEEDQLFRRDFEVWYCNTGSKEKLEIKKFQDESKYARELPKIYKEITGMPRYTASELSKVPEGYECIYSGQDSENRKRWYFAIIGSERIKGQEKVDNFPGYGRLYEREFKVWYSDVGSKDIKDEQIIQDRFPLHYEPKNSKNITGEGVYLDRLDNTKGYESLFSGLDNKNRKRWYFALVKFTPTWIETKRAIEEESVKIEKEDIEVPEGWELVRNHSEKWIELNYDKGFPGYGKVYNITFEVWYSDVGSKDKIEQPSISVHLALYGKNENIYYFERVCDQIEGLNGKQVNFDRLSRAQGYSQLYNGLDNSTKQRWYLGIKEMRPTNYFTAKA